MVVQADLQNVLAQALGEFGPAWKIVSDCSPVNPLDPSHWAVGSQSFHVNLRHRVTGRLKVLGRRVADEPSASLHRAVAHSLVDAYVRGNTDPIRRYLEDIGVAASSERDAAHFFRRPVLVSPAAEPVRELAELGEAHAPVAPPAPVVPPARVAPPAQVAPAHVVPPAHVAPVEHVAPAPVALVAVAAALSSGSMGARMASRTGVGRPRILSRFKREFKIWQWRRATGSIDIKSTLTRDG